MRSIGTTRQRSWAIRLATLALVLVACASTRRAAGQAAPTPTTTPTALSVAAPPDVAPFAGKLISAVAVEIDDATWKDVLATPVRSVRVGDHFSSAGARRALSEVLDSGFFARGRVSAVADAMGGVRLVVRVVPKKRIETLRLDLHGARVDRDELLKAADLVEGGEIVGRDLPEQQKRIEAFLARHGYPSSTVSLTLRDTDSVTSVLLLVDVVPGVPRLVQRRFFYVYGATRADVAVDTDAYLVGRGDRLDEGRLDAADTALSGRLRARGYEHASVTHDVIRDRGLSTLRVRVDAGPRFVVRFEGNEHYDKDALDAALAFDTDLDRSAGHMVQKLHDYYVKRGFLDAEISAETRGQPEAPAGEERLDSGLPPVELVLHIVEHRRVLVASRAYPCLRVDEIRGLSSGAPTSPTAIGNEIDSYLEDELPGDDLFRDPDPKGTELTFEGPSHFPRAAQPVPIDLDPDGSFSADTYDRATLHVQELYRNEGYLHAQVGPVQLVRRRCDPKGPGGACVPLPLTSAPPDACTYDENSLPLPVAPLDAQLSCTPDPTRGVACEPRLGVRIPIKLGPRTKLYDLAFTGARSIEEKKLAVAANLVLGQPANVLKLDEARRHVIDAYKEEGFAYVDVKYSLDESLDHTRARATFAIHEGDRVRVKRIVIRGNEVTNESVIRRRIALVEGGPYRSSLVRKTQERIATLNVFSSIDVSLEDAYVPQPEKTVVVTVVEHASQYIEVKPGLSTGEGVRFAFEYGHRNLFGDAIALSLRIQLSYLPDFLILDPQVRQNYDRAFGYPAFDKRIATRSTATLALPDIGLGPLFRATVDGVFVRDLERDFALTKEAGIVTLYYRPVRQLQFSIAPDVEANDVLIFGAGTVEQYLQEQQQTNGGANADLQRLLRLPTGQSDAVAQRFLMTWDRRDNSFNAHRGTYVSSGVEHVDWGALGGGACPTVPRPNAQRSYYGAAGWNALANSPLPKTSIGLTCEASEGHFLRFTETFAAYIPITKKITLAGEIRIGFNTQLLSNSATYPDRLFFMGGIDSMRGWLQDTFVPQDYADQIARDQGKPSSDPTKFTINDVALRGGNLMINPRLELRIPIVSPLETVIFFDSGNLWADASYPFKSGLHIPLRFSAGTGLRLQTPIGPVVFDYGVNLSRLIDGPDDPRYSYEDFGAFHFAIGLF